MRRHVILPVLAMLTLVAADVAGAAARGWLPPAAALDRVAMFARWRAAHPQSLAKARRAIAEARAAPSAANRQGATTPWSLRTRGVGTMIWECVDCPQMIVVPAGAFEIGSPLEEPGRGVDEGPLTVVKIPQPFAVARFEITRGEYEAFLRATGRPVLGGCVTDRAKPGEWAPHPEMSLRDPGFPQGDDHPVVCVTFDDAQAYVAWINGRTSGGYRLLSEAEWEYVARAGTRSAYPWGSDAGGGCADANGADQTIGDVFPDWKVAGCRDGAMRTAPVGRYRPNPFGLHDLIGNVGEWVADCATQSYEALPRDGSANLTGDCARRVVRSGSWGSQVKDYRVANRIRYPVGQVDDSIGIRLAKSLD